ncbi:polygalacturonase-like [Anthonomus grandis grandis]|uniref:polygalacturonase-like n=1 Tax=Anthonomus grandis grandis TaxID=2921223 RepID=UPI0021656416|nr:polygalacturonase-like [Anthonomus grandis grandis]
MTSLQALPFFAILAIVSATPTQPLEASCTVTSYDNIAAAVSSCTTLTLKDITVPASTTLSLSLKTGTTLTLAGTFKWEYAEWKGPLFEIKGSKVTVKGDSVTLDGRGAKWWDGKGDKGKKKPKFLRIKTTGGSTLKDIKLLNCPHQCVSINSASDTTIDNFYLELSAGDTAGGHNTDGFDISSSTGITIENSIVKNQDDCVAVNQGSNMIFKNLTCSGGHGLSLSVGQSSENGSPNTVSNITFSDCTVMKSDNGIHIKTHSDAGTGAVKDVTYKNIKLSGIKKYGINIQEDYENGSSSGTPKGNIPITNLVLNSITGSMTGDSNSMAVYILCGTGGCSNWQWSSISISSAAKTNKCNYTPTGFTC